MDLTLLSLSIKVFRFEFSVCVCVRARATYVLKFLLGIQLFNYLMHDLISYQFLTNPFMHIIKRVSMSRDSRYKCQLAPTTHTILSFTSAAPIKESRQLRLYEWIPIGVCTGPPLIARSNVHAAQALIHPPGHSPKHALPTISKDLSAVLSGAGFLKRVACPR